MLNFFSFFYKFFDIYPSSALSMHLFIKYLELQYIINTLPNVEMK